MTHTSNKGTIYYSDDKKRWIAEYRFADGKRSYQSPYRHDCEVWLQGVRKKGSAADVSSVDMEMMRREVDGNPKQVPGFPTYFLNDDNKLFRCKNGRVRELKMCKAGTYCIYTDGKPMNCGVNKLRYCVDQDISPTMLSLCRLSVERGEDGLSLVDITERIQKSIRRNKNDFYTKYAQDYLQMTEEWCHNVLQVHKGDTDAIINLRKIIERMRPELERYIRTSLRQTGEAKVKFLIEETESETLGRAISRTAAVCNPWQYMRNLARNLHWQICRHHGRIIRKGDQLRVIGGWEEVFTDKIVTY